jgi:hypothetical protein
MKSYEVKLVCMAKSKVHATVMVDAEDYKEAKRKALENARNVEWSHSIGEIVSYDDATVVSVEAIVDLDEDAS